MKIRIWSDLHNEFSLFMPKGKFKDQVLVLAGDIGVTRKPDEFEYVLEHYLGMFSQVVMVAGNHEAYGSSIKESNEYLRSLDRLYANFYFLDDDYVIIDDVVFIGSTYWTHITNHEKICGALNDFHVIEGFSTYLGNEYNQKAHKFISDMCGIFSENKKVVITHHSPSYKSLHPDYVTSDINEAFMNNDDDLVARSGAAAWIHGHTHETASWKINDTPVICNPRGYKTNSFNDEVNGFNQNLVIEV